MKLKNMLLALFIVTLSLVSNFTNAENIAAKKGYDIALTLENRDNGFKDSSAKLTMRLKNGLGAEALRELDIKILEDSDEGNKTLIIFDFPVDIKGTSLLTHPKKARSDDQWLYLPVVNRTKRISSRNKSGSFMGSEFSFEDMISKDVDDFNYNFISTEPCNNLEGVASEFQCDVIEKFPLDKHSGYSKQKLWIEQDSNKVYRIEYYDRKKSLLKVLTASNFKLYLDKYWRANVVNMHNVQTDKVTVLEYNSISFSSGLNDNDFHRSVLGD
ncbi:outer membrane lipoprotein-sorting protein [Rheinheimera sp. MMS21-TC3]|uniref:outer membrane lipoprotein-sorting protein n=1 Tax=Rheinheimera sp. MMS21-TC3 TaxID=3072790 RepID=UPI0028C4C68C|nr:outer membrane lipoprotein-sorting protein [Rheinheimera sp. MMS21-TC3]WNO60630.1 outer membrane lipoprotein-sorting protein [Rheinheimera sp. MMS21-TC3]